MALSQLTTPPPQKKNVQVGIKDDLHNALKPCSEKNLIPIFAIFIFWKIINFELDKTWKNSAIKKLQKFRAHNCL